MLVGADPAPLEPADEHIDRRVVLIAGHNDTVDGKVVLAEHVDDAQHFQVIGDAEVLPRLARRDIACIHADDDLRLVLHSLQEFDLGVLVKSGQHAHRVLVLHELAAELQIEPALSAFYPLEDVFGLLFNILVRIKSNFLHFSLSACLENNLLSFTI